MRGFLDIFREHRAETGTQPGTQPVKVRRATAVVEDGDGNFYDLPDQQKDLTWWGKLQLARALWAIKSKAQSDMKKSSWKTTLGGILLALSPISTNVLPASYHWVSEALATLGGLILGGTARDNDVTSEQAGAKH